MRDKIFKIIWDINGALFLLLLLALGGLMSFELVTGLMKSDTPPVRVNLAEDEKGKENWQLGYPESITGYDLYFIPLESDNRQVETEVGSATADFVANSRFRKFFTPTKNIVFVNSITNQSYWMFPENNQFILDTEQIVVTAADSPGANDSVTKYTRAISYRVSSQDTNGDNRVDKADKPSFALSRHDGSDFKTIIKKTKKLFQLL